MKYPKRQFDNPESMKFCGQCGAKPENICLKCEFTNPSGFQFCGECGEKLGAGSKSESATAISKLEDVHAKLQRSLPKSLAEQIQADAGPCQNSFLDPELIMTGGIE